MNTTMNTNKRIKASHGYPAVLGVIMTLAALILMTGVASAQSVGDDGVEPALVDGPVVVLENLGSAEITSAVVAFDTPAGDPPHLFGYQGQFLGRNNPLPAGAVACTAPIPGLVNGSHLTLDQIAADANLFIDMVTTDLRALGIQIDTTVMPFDLAYQTATGGSITGQYRVVSESPCTGDTPEGEPSAPTGLSVTAPDDGSGTLFLDWDDNFEADVIDYNVYLSLARTGPYGLVATSLDESQYTDSGLTNGTEYHYVVSAVNGGGTESAKSTVTSNIPAELTAPEAPTGLRITAMDREAGSVELDWEDNSEADLAGYNVYRQLGNEDSFSQIAAGVPTADYIDTEVPEEVPFLYVVTAVDTEGNESSRSNIAPLPMDFFGTVLGFRSNTVDERILVVRTNDRRAEVVVTSETEIRLPQVENATITDLSKGDVVAVTMMLQNGRLVAEKIQLVPNKTNSRHVPGTVTSIEPNVQVTIQPPGNGKEPITFTLSGTAKINYHRGITGIEVGSFVVVGAVRDPGTGQLSPLATEINVTVGKKADQGQSNRAKAKAKPKKAAKLQGIFEGINPDNGNLILASIEVPLGADTEIQAGLVAGDAVEVEAEVLPDGSLLALEVEKKEEDDGEVSEKTRLNGVFEGIDQATGQWIIGGTPVTVSNRTDTDGTPQLGQRVKVTALLQEDGSLHAREIENESGRGRPSDQDDETELEGTFEGTDADGNWIIGGRKIAVDAVTGLEGNPSVGRRVSVEAIKDRAGRLLARKIKDESDNKRETKREAKLKGVVDRVLTDGSLVVDGVRVAISALTELATVAKAGDRVEIHALLQENGDFLAREIEADLDGDGEESNDASPVDIEGEIESVNPDGSLVVNGIRIAISALSDVRGDLKAGAAVRVRGLREENGNVLARSLRSEGRKATKSGTEAKVQGRVDRVNRNDDGSIRSVVVNGVTVALEALTKTDADLETGRSVEVEGILNNGQFVASKVAQKQRGKVDRDDGEVEIEGAIEEVKRNAAGRVVAVVINGVEVSVAQSAQLRGSLEVGQEVELKGTVRDGNLVADKVEGKESEIKKGRPTKSDIQGIVQNVVRDADGKLVSLVIADHKYIVEPLSRGRGNVAEGDTVRIEGLNRDGVLLAAAIVPVRNRDRAQANRKNAEAKSKSEREALSEAAKQARERAKEQAANARETGGEEDESDKDDEDSPRVSSVSGGG